MTTLTAAGIPEEEKNNGPQDRLIHVYHFTRDSHHNQLVKNFGEPFLLVIHEKETVAEIKGRIQKRLQVPDEDFAKWKFAVLKPCPIEYLEDSDVMSARFQGGEFYSGWEQYLGLEHVNTDLEPPAEEEPEEEEPAEDVPEEEETDEEKSDMEETDDKNLEYDSPNDYNKNYNLTSDDDGGDSGDEEPWFLP